MNEQITLLGVGWNADDLTLRAVKILQGAQKIVLQTNRLGCADWLDKQFIAYETLDAIYDSAEDFDEFIENAVDFLLERAQEQPLVYAASELTDQVALEIARRREVQPIAGVLTGGSLTAYTGSSLRVVSAIDYEEFVPQACVATLVRELDSPMYASEMKLKLMNCYPSEQRILLYLPDGEIRSIPLCDLDRLENYDHRLCALVPAENDLTRLERFDFDGLLRIVRRLRGFDGCPWDREQTHESLRASLIEEAYEAVDAINQEDTDALYDELGDILLQVALHSEIGREHGEFDASDVTTAIGTKMIRRHPHVFAGEAVDDLQAEWDRIKREEKGDLTSCDAMRSVARSLPALTRAKKVLTKAARAGLCEQDLRSAAQHAKTALDELNQALLGEKNASEKAGEMLFRLVNLLRIGNTDPEMILSEKIDCLIRQFEQAETQHKE